MRILDLLGDLHWDNSEALDFKAINDKSWRTGREIRVCMIFLNSKWHLLGSPVVALRNWQKNSCRRRKEMFFCGSVSCVQGVIYVVPHVPCHIPEFF